MQRHCGPQLPDTVARGYAAAVKSYAAVVAMPRGAYTHERNDARTSTTTHDDDGPGSSSSDSSNRSSNQQQRSRSNFAQPGAMLSQSSHGVNLMSVSAREPNVVDGVSAECSQRVSHAPRRRQAPRWVPKVPHQEATTTAFVHMLGASCAGGYALNSDSGFSGMAKVPTTRSRTRRVGQCPVQQVTLTGAKYFSMSAADSDNDDERQQEHVSTSVGVSAVDNVSWGRS